MEYAGKVVVITGASSGIGYVTAQEFARRGAVVVAIARREVQLQELMRLCRVESPASSYLCGDLADRSFAERAIDDTVATHGRIDVLVNNAAVSKHKQIYHLSADEVDYVMRVNCMSYMWTTLAAIPPMLRAGGGTIVNVSSFAAKLAPPREPIYAASKAAVNLFSEGLWADLQGSNIHVALINPGAIDTEIWDKEDEPVAFRGRKHPPEIIRDAIFEAIEKRVYEKTVPRSPELILARIARLLAPSLMRSWLARFDPVPREVIERARARAEKGKRLGDLTES